MQPKLKRILSILFLPFGVGACVNIGGVENGKSYHCVGLTQPINPPDVAYKIIPVEKFEYGSYQRENTPTVGGSYYCSQLIVPDSAYLRYRLDGRVVEKRFDLSMLKKRRIVNKTVEFLVINDKVELRLITSVLGGFPRYETISIK